MTSRILVADDALQELSRRENANITCIHVGPVERAGNSWSLNMGVDFKEPQPRDMRMCCCSGTARFTRTGSTFHFAGWGLRICA